MVVHHGNEHNRNHARVFDYRRDLVGCSQMGVASFLLWLVYAGTHQSGFTLFNTFPICVNAIFFRFRHIDSMESVGVIPLLFSSAPERRDFRILARGIHFIIIGKEHGDDSSRIFKGSCSGSKNQ